MNNWHRLLLACVLFPAVSGCSDGSVTSPSAPTETPAAQRVIQINGNLDFGNVPVGSTMTSTVTISNAGTSVLTVSAISVVGVGVGPSLQVNWTSGTILPNASQQVTVQFKPGTTQTYSGSLVVLSDATSGSNTMPASGTGTSEN